MAKQVHDASLLGDYQGWEDDLPAGSQMKPIFSVSGLPQRLNFSLERVKKAEKKLGCKLLTNSTWLFPFFDCYVQVMQILVHEYKFKLLTNVFFTDAGRSNAPSQSWVVGAFAERDLFRPSRILGKCEKVFRRVVLRQRGSRHRMEQVCRSKFVFFVFFVF